jgi:hypothetical protein
MIIASYFTPSYRANADVLRASCERFGHAHKIIELPEQGSWIGGIHKKCQVILNTLIDVRQPVVWIDADCELLKPIPDQDWQDFDWAGHDWHTENRKTNPDYPATDDVLHSGGVTIWNYTAPAIELLLRWHRALVANPEAVDDQVLDAVVNRAGVPLRWKHLPKEMNWMPFLFGPLTPDVIVRHDYVPK